MSKKKLLEERIEYSPDEYDSLAKKKTYRVKNSINKNTVRKIQKPDSEETDRREIEKDKKNTYLKKEDIEELEALERMQEEATQKKSERRKQIFGKIGIVFMSCLCIYVVLLIYGIFVTDYVYDDSGKVVPAVVTVSDIEKRNEYNELVAMYYQVRTLYEKILLLDYRVSRQEEDLKVIAPEYQQTIDEVNKLEKQIDGADLSSQYNQVRKLMYELVKYHMFNYCQYISTAITEDNSNAETEALLARGVIEDSFMLITENVIKLGNVVPGYDITDIKQWSPSGYIMETTGSIEF